MTKNNIYDNTSFNRIEGDIIIAKLEVEMWEKLSEIKNKYVNNKALQNLNSSRDKLCRLTEQMVYFKNCQEKEVKENFATLCFPTILKSRETERKDELKDEINLEKSVLCRVKKMPEEMERLIGEMCPEVAYQKRLVKAEYISENKENIMMMVESMNKTRVYKLETHIQNQYLSIFYKNDLKKKDISKLSNTDKVYKDRTKPKIIYDIYEKLSLELFNSANERSAEILNRELKKKKTKTSWLQLDFIIKIFKGIEYQNSVYTKKSNKKSK